MRAAAPAAVDGARRWVGARAAARTARRGALLSADLASAAIVVPGGARWAMAEDGVGCPERGEGFWSGLGARAPRVMSLRFCVLNALGWTFAHVFGSLMLVCCGGDVKGVEERGGTDAVIWRALVLPCALSVALAPVLLPLAFAHFACVSLPPQLWRLSAAHPPSFVLFALRLAAPALVPPDLAAWGARATRVAALACLLERWGQPAPEKHAGRPEFFHPGSLGSKGREASREADESSEIRGQATEDGFL